MYISSDSDSLMSFLTRRLQVCLCFYFLFCHNTHHFFSTWFGYCFYTFSRNSVHVFCKIKPYWIFLPATHFSNGSPPPKALCTVLSFNNWYSCPNFEFPICYNYTNDSQNSYQIQGNRLTKCGKKICQCYLAYSHWKLQQSIMLVGQWAA